MAVLIAVKQGKIDLRWLYNLISIEDRNLLLEPFSFSQLQQIY